MDIISLLRLAKDKGASDLHLVANSPPLLRIHGSLQLADKLPPLSGDDTIQFINQLTSEAERKDFYRCLELDFGYSIPGVGRFRCNAARQQGTISLVIRLLPL